MTTITPPDFLIFELSRWICIGVISVIHNGCSVVAVEPADSDYWLIGRSGNVKTIIDRVAYDATMEVRITI